MLDSLAKKVAPQHTAVLVVDMQNEFVEEGGLRGREGDDVSSARALVPRVKRFLDYSSSKSPLIPDRGCPPD